MTDEPKRKFVHELKAQDFHLERLDVDDFLKGRVVKQYDVCQKCGHRHPSDGPCITEPTAA